MVGKVEMGLMALFEPIVLASASFLIDFFRALTFNPDSEADFCRFLVELMYNSKSAIDAKDFFVRMTFHCNDEHIDIFRFMASEARKLRWHLCKKWACSAS